VRPSLVFSTLLGAALLATAIVFYLAPDVDLDVAGQFYRGRNMFAGQTPAGELVRRVVYWVPTALLVGSCALTVVRWLGYRVGWAPSWRGLLFLALSFALGPGLLVNTVLKDHSHRPRPYQTLNFGGDHAFRPYYTFDGDCERNCSFVSGEGSSAAWTLAPALLTPAPVEAMAVAASLVFALGVGLLRMAFGGHYLSDTLFALLLTWSLVWVLRALMVPRTASRPSR
jgi:lipid A 4'-phosphatase